MAFSTDITLSGSFVNLNSVSGLATNLNFIIQNKTSKDIVLFVHSLMVEVYDLDGEITKSVGRNLMIQYLELDYATLEEIRIRLEEM